MKLFPYKPRRYQEEIVQTIFDCLKDRKHLIMEAPAGSGKTICALVACLSFASENDKGIIYLTRTNSQQKQAIQELKRIAEKLDLKAVSIQGRTNTCLLIDAIPSLKEKNMSNEDVARLCAARKKRSLEAMRGKEKWNRCIFFENFLLIKNELKFDRVVAAEELVEYGRKYKICAYEMNKMLAKKADIIIAPYIYIFDEFLREKFSMLYSRPFEETILIIDEAHNLPDFCRELLSFSLSLRTLNAAINEADEYGVRDEDIINLLHILKKIFEVLREEIEFSETNDALLAEKRFENSLMEDGIDKSILQQIAEKMVTYGDIIADIKESKNMLPRSFIRSVGNFLLHWLSLNEKWVRIVEREEDNVRIEAYCLDASLASSIINSFYCSIHMSGTLQPLEEYRNSIGIDAVTAKFPSPFPEENRRIFYMEGVTTKYYMEEEMLNKIKEQIEKICNSVDRNILILFPSYIIMNRFLKKLKINRECYVENRGERQKSIMEKLQKFKQKGGVFLSVMGGRLAEGIDFPSEELEIVIIVGIPYPPPSAKQYALQQYYDEKYGNGWKYVMEAQAVRKIMQAIGRLIRKEDDRGIAIIMDERAKRFKKYIKMEKAGDIVAEINEFLG